MLRVGMPYPLRIGFKLGSVAAARVHGTMALLRVMIFQYTHLYTRTGRMSVSSGKSEVGREIIRGRGQ
jgi:hypothetical protein